MDCTSTRLPYRQASHFSKTVLDYLDHAPALKDFYAYALSLQGIQQAIEMRRGFATDRETLVQELRKQYKDIHARQPVQKNIDALRKQDCFTITTAHQPNIFTGPLYFIYKILHAIKLAEYCQASLPGSQFVPVFYMGSEDADLEELGHFYIQGQKYTWNTKQTGAVGRMKVDKELRELITLAAGQLTVLPFGNEIIELIKECYAEGRLVQEATFHFVNALFGELGLVVLIPDNAALKNRMRSVFEDELLNQRASALVRETADRLQLAGYKTQAHPREINLFYLKDGIRERIEEKNGVYSVVNSKYSFSKDEMMRELNEHPERFSPNVILRGLFQETILPNLVFIGGGGELSYWLELKELFKNYRTPFPVLVLRNSFLIVERKWKEKMAKLGFTVEDFFLPSAELLNKLVARESGRQIKLNGNFTETEQLYEALKKQVAEIDVTLARHVEALKTQSLYRLQELEKKMLRAEKRKFSDHQRQIEVIKNGLFPGNGLQERGENFMYYYSKWGKEFIRKLYQHSLMLEQEFVIVAVKG
jgi:bacillithiol biosynthesis cysteine-adding enzyme BshC